MSKEMLGAKVSPKTLERLEEYADRVGISKSEATDRLLKQGLDVEESDMRLVPVQTDGGTKIEKKLDGIDGRLNEIDREIGEVESDQNRIIQYGFTMMIALIWIGLNVVFSLPTWFVVPSGLILIFTMIYPLATNYVDSMRGET